MLSTGYILKKPKFQNNLFDNNYIFCNLQIAACEICHQKEEKRSQLCKKVKTIDFISETISQHSPDVCLDDAITCSETDDLYDTAKQNMEQIQSSLKKIQHYEKEIVNMAKKADLDIDDVLDFLLAKIVKLISRKKREMKAQVMNNSCLTNNANRYQTFLYLKTG
jgi:hypothetical protein